MHCGIINAAIIIIVIFYDSTNVLIQIILNIYIEKSITRKLYNTIELVIPMVRINLYF